MRRWESLPGGIPAGKIPAGALEEFWLVGNSDPYAEGNKYAKFSRSGDADAVCMSG